MTAARYEVLDAALNVMVKGPTPLEPTLDAVRALAGLTATLSIDELFEYLRKAPADDALRYRLRTSLYAWDYDLTGEWTVSTARNTDERRQLIYERLELPAAFREFLDLTLPFASQEPVIVVAESFRQWYSEERRRARQFYWSAYRRYLQQVRSSTPRTSRHWMRPQRPSLNG